MPDSAVASLTAASALTGTELFYADDGTNDVKVTSAQIKSYVGGGGFVIESLGASPDASAAVNAAAIQSALDTGGLLTLTTPGTYQISTELQIGSNTDLYLAPGVILQRAADDMNLISTKALHVADASVTLSWPGGHSAKITVTWTSHGLAAGDAFCVAGANQSCFNGVFLVESVVNSSSFTYETIRLPTTNPTGTTVARKCNSRVWIRGGTWDLNNPTYSGDPLTSAALMIGYLYDGGTQDIHYINGETFAINSGALRSVKFLNTTATTSFGDIVKVYGPAFGVRVDGIDGTAEDDMFSFQTKEFDEFVTYRWTFGDILGCTAGNINGSQAAGSVGAVASCYISANEIMDEVHYHDLYGTIPGTTSPLFFMNGRSATDTADHVTISRIKGWSAANPLTFTLGRARHVTIRDLEPIPYPDSSGGTANTIYVVSDFTINKLDVENVTFPSSVSWTGSHYLVQIAGEVDDLTIRGVQAKSSSNLWLALSAASSTLKSANFYDIVGNFGASDMVELKIGSLGTPKISYYGGRISAADSLVYTRGPSFSAAIFGTIIESVTSGVLINDGSPTINGVICGARLDAGDWTASFSGSPTYLVKVLAETGITVTNPTTETIYRFNADGIQMLPDTGVNYIGQQDKSYIQFDKAGVVGLWDWASGTHGTFSGGSKTPSQITGNQNNYNPGGYAYFQRWSTDASRDITGLTFTVAQEDGETHIIFNAGAQNIVLKHESGSSTDVNRFTNSGAADVTLTPGLQAMVIYDGTTLRWRVNRMAG